MPTAQLLLNETIASARRRADCRKSTRRCEDCFPVANLTYEQAIAYLRKEAVVLDAGVPRGYVLVAYQDVPLGFVKNIGNRANNLYPQEWRIRSGYLPENLKMVF